MARNGRFNRGSSKAYRSKPRRGRKRKKTIKLSLSQAKSRKIDNNSERILVALSKRVAAAEIAKSRVSLIRRIYIGGDYQPDTNIFTNLREVDFGGLICELSNIPKTDVEMIANSPQNDDPLTTGVMYPDQGNENLDGDGIAQGLITQNLHGRRTSDSVRMVSVRLDIEAFLDRIPSDPGGFRPVYDSSVLRYGIYAVRCPDVALVGWAPTVDVLIQKPHMFGYTPKLDTDEAMVRADLTVKTLCEGSMALKFRHDRCDRRRRTVFGGCKLLLNWDPADQNGQSPLKWKLFAAFRSDIPVHQDYLAYKPKICACSRLFYYEP